jgi:Kdo2-lipid IVA lauroyltransferase/acyltransferase
MKYIGYLFFRFVTFLFSLMPFRLMYWLSDFTAFMLRKVFKYRYKVIYENLKNSFPNKTEEEIKHIVKGAYSNLADITLEGIKCFSMSESTICKRYVFTNPSVLNDSDRAGGNSIVMAAHYGNWEWGTVGFPLFIKKCVVGFYKPLSNKYIDAYGRKSRGNTGLELVSIAKTAWAFEAFKDRPASYVLVSDQNPASDKAHWVNFLNQDTACLYGGDKYARHYNYPVYFTVIERIKRGFYTVTLEELILNPREAPPEGITQIFMNRLEKQITAQPENWLWSHKRWKIKRTT